MNDWTLSSFLIALTLVVFAAAAIGHLARRAGFKAARMEDPIKRLKRRERNKFHNSLGVLTGLASLMLIYPLSCRLGSDMNVLGLSDEALTFLLVLAGGLLLPLYLAWRNKRR